MTDTLYHRFLRVSLVVVAFVLLFDGGFVSPITKQFSDATVMYLAQSVGASARVEPNDVNTITAALTAKEQELANREARLRDIEARDFGSEETDYSTYILSSILFILTMLIVTNYVLDWRRARNFAV